MSDATAASVLDDADPAAPGSIDEGLVGGADADAANLGLDGRGDVWAGDAGGLEGTPSGQPGTLDIDIAKASAFLQQCMTSNPRVGYKLGAKAKPGGVPGRDFTNVDCSGFVREAIRRSTDLGGRFPDGSVVQHDWVKAQGFPLSSVAAASARDGSVNIAFLSPADTASHIGHVVLVHQGKTLESHSHVGPDSRPWNGQGWQAKARVYVLRPSLQS